MSATVIRNARVLTMLAPGETRPPEGGRRGAAHGTLGILEKADVYVDSGIIVEVAPECSWSNVDHEINADGRVLMPGFVDCHTHACWAGSRLDEWERKLAGATYQEIAAAGGGIMSTVRAVRGSTGGQLGLELQSRTSRMARLGSTTIEVKSGYGLRVDYELRMLRAIANRARSREAMLVPTALLGHALDPEAASPEAFVEETVESTLPKVAAARPGITVDAFCEQGAWSRAQCERLFRKATELGLPIRVHADQFTSMGMVESAIALGARSVDHLEASTPETLAAIAASGTFGVGLPLSGFHLDGRYARLGEIVRHGGKVCIATNYNPGSAPSPSMQLAIALAVRHCGLTPAQAIVAATLNPAQLLGLKDRGYIGPCARADLILLRHRDERLLAYEVGDNPVYMVMFQGMRRDLWRGVS